MPLNEPALVGLESFNDCKKQLNNFSLKTVRFAIFIFLSACFSHKTFAYDIFVPDDYDTISEAMEEAEDGDTVIVMEGVYNERVKIKEGVNLVSDSADGGDELVEGPGKKKVLRRALRTIIDGSGLPPGYLVSFAHDTSTPMKLDGFTLANQPEYPPGTYYFMLEIRGCSPVVTNNIITGNKAWGGILSTGLGIRMGPPLETKAKPLIKNNVSYNNRGPGISNGPNSAALVVENELFDNYFEGDRKDAPGIGIKEYARPIVKENICYRNGSGIGGDSIVADPAPLEISENLVFANRRSGIAFSSINVNAGSVVVHIRNNEVHSNRYSGIALNKIDDAHIEGNTIYNNMKAGIVMIKLQSAAIENNEVSGNQTAGMKMYDVSAATVKGNHVHQNLAGGIDIAGWVE